MILLRVVVVLVVVVCGCCVCGCCACVCLVGLVGLVGFWTRPIDQRCMSVRTRTHHEEMLSNWIRETAQLSQERSVASKVLLKALRLPTKPPGNNLSITLEEHLPPHELTFPTIPKLRASVRKLS